MELRNNDYEYIEVLSKLWTDQIDEIVSTGSQINENGDLELYINCWMKFNINMKFRIATVKENVTITYINGVRKDYIRRKSALNALLKVYNTVVDFREFKNSKEKMQEINESVEPGINENLNDFVCCDYENSELFGKTCTVIDNISYYEYAIVDIENTEYRVYKNDICNNKVDILNKIIFKLSDYSDLYIKDVKVLNELFTVKGVEITLSKNELNNCNTFKDLYRIAKMIIKELFNEPKEIIKENNNIEQSKQNLKESFLVGNLNFNSYELAYEYCISSDFDPELMIKSVSGNTLKTNILDNNNIKIKLLDNKINRIMDNYMDLKKEIDKQGIKYNDRKNSLIHELKNLNNTMDNLESRIDELMKDNEVIRLDNFKLNLAALKEEYKDCKYKVISGKNDFIFTNDLKNYLHDPAYNIKFLLDNREVYKQLINKNTDGLYGNSYTVYFYKNKDTVNTLEKKELYSLDTNKLLMKEIHKSKKNMNICYCKAAINKDPLILINGKSPIHDTLNKAIEVFKKDNEIIDILESYTIKETVKPSNGDIKDNRVIMLDEYKEALNKFPGLKKACDNLEYYNNLYKDNINLFFRKFKTNTIEFSNYRINYLFYKDYLLKLDPGTKEKIDYKTSEKVVYTTHYNKR